MIIDLPDTTTSAINRKIVDLRDSGGAVALGRVMTLVIVTDDSLAEDAIRAANDASREHPCRVIALVSANKRGSIRLDGQIRVGGDAGASEVIVLRLYGPLANHGDSAVVPLLLPDAPIVVWWPGAAPEAPGDDPLGRMAQRRITDAAHTRNPIRTIEQGATNHVPGTTDLAWTRISHWRALLAAALDQPPYEPVSAIEVTGGSDSSSTDLLAAWLALYLQAPVKRVKTAAGSGTIGVVLQRRTGSISLQRPDGNVAILHHHDQPERRVALPRRQDNDCLAEELRRLEPDDVFGDVITRGLQRLNETTTKPPAARRKKASATRSAPKPAEKPAPKPAEKPAEKPAAKTAVTKKAKSKAAAAS